MSDPLEKLAEELLNYAKLTDARFEAMQAQYAVMQTNMEIIKQQQKHNHDATMNLLNAMLYLMEKEKV